MTVYPRIFRAIPIVAVIAMSIGVGTAWSHTQRVHSAAGLAYSASAHHAKFASDPHAFGGGDREMDNLYTLNTFICTDGIATNVAFQMLGDINNPSHQGHALRIGTIQDYGTTTRDAGSSATDVSVREGGYPFTLFSSPDNVARNGSPATDASSLWTGQTAKVHFQNSEPAGEEVVMTLQRLDHGFVLNEDDEGYRPPGAAVDPNINGDDAHQYQGWIGADDGSAATSNTPPTTPNFDGDWYVAPDGVGATDGSSFDDAIRTDQSPSGAVNPNDPNSTPSYTVKPDPSTSKVDDCVIDQAPPQTSISRPGNSGITWYTGPISVSLAAHKVYYLGGAVTTYYRYSTDGSDPSGLPWQVYSSPLQLGYGNYVFQYYSADSAGDSETPHVDSFKINKFDFFQPVDSPPVVNVAKAGSTIPVKFSLTGNKGLNIFAPGYPTFIPTTCGTLSSDPTSAIDQTVTAGNSSLTYDTTTDQYTYAWKTSPTWARSCGVFTATLIDGISHTAYFSFK